VPKPLQPSLPFPAPAAAPRASRKQAAVTHEARKRETAALILETPEAYGGEGSLPVEWARKILGVAQ